MTAIDLGEVGDGGAGADEVAVAEDVVDAGDGGPVFGLADVGEGEGGGFASASVRVTFFLGIISSYSVRNNYELVWMIVKSDPCNDKLFSSRRKISISSGFDTICTTFTGYFWPGRCARRLACA